MIDIRALAKPDILLLRKPFIVLLVACAVAFCFYFALGVFSQRVSSALSNARAQFDQVSTSVQQIAQEEQTIIRYIDRYNQIEADGVVSTEDRLHLLEAMSDIRSQYSLYPLEIDLSEQTITQLQGDPYALNPAGPVDLQSTSVSFVLPLLHEQDLTHFTERLLDDNGLLVPQHCVLELINTFNTDFSSLGEHLQADCTILWYTFNVDALEVLPDGY